MRFQAIVFDLDGTLLDTLDDIADTSNRVLAAHGLPSIPRDDYRGFVGEGLGRLFERVLPAAIRTERQMRECIEHFREEYGRRWNDRTHPYEGVAEMLRDVAGRQIRMAVLSNKPHEFTLRCVRAHFDDGCFDAVLGQSEEVPAKPDPTGAQRIVAQFRIPPERFLYLGDTGTDMQTAVAAGFYPVGVLWGYRERTELIDNGAAAVIAHPSELIEILDRPDDDVMT
jgi:phosphoglycolate phosphatase